MRQPSQELFRDLVEFAPDALILVDANGLILYANTHAHTLFGYPADQLTQVSVDELIPLESRGLHAAHRIAYSQNPRLREMGNRDLPLFGLRRDGTRFRAEIRIAPIKTAHGHVIAAAVRDATETQQPMTERALATMSELLHALLNIAKLETGSLQTSLSDVFLPKVFDDLREQFGALAKLKKLELVVATPDVHVRTDPVLLTEMLQNLLANGLRYTDRGQLTLSCTPRETGVYRSKWSTLE